MPVQSTPRPPAGSHPARMFHYAALFEGTTLVLLVVIAVPLKYLLGEPAPVKALGPLHGMAFLAYLWALMGLQASAQWPRKRVALLLLAAFVPFGSFIALTRMGLARAGKRKTQTS